MPSYISPLDPDYMSLRQAAACLIESRPGLSHDDIMQMFKHAIFTGEFERRETHVRNDEDINYLHLLIETPPGRHEQPPLKLENAAREYFAVKRKTIAQILYGQNALPEGSEKWSDIYQVTDKEIVRDFYYNLAHIPYGALPEKGRSILEGIVISRLKLEAWLTFKGFEISEPDPQPVKDNTPLPEYSNDNNKGRGRRTKNWQKIQELGQPIIDANPGLSRKQLVGLILEEAEKHLPKAEIPSEQTLYTKFPRIFLS
ncbi:hypothetical protein MJD09_17265 [bacterium]|nr:hypothetical protein [bacterium]